MKYIRTKKRENGLAIILKSEHYYHNELCYCGAEKTADTIEELCDGEVIVWKDSTPSIWNKFLSTQEFEHLYSSFQRKKIIAIYGAIWTEWGLKYVAKLNDEGELELL